MAPRVENQMGRWGAVSYIVGNIVGSGIFIIPAFVVQNTGSVGLSLLVWLLSALIAIIGAFCYVELGTRIRRSGGDFAYLCHVKWNAAAFAFMACGCILTFPLTLAIQAESFAEFLLQGLRLDLNCYSPLVRLLARKCIGYGLCWLLLFLNFFSLRTAVARFQMICSLAKVLSIGLIIVTGFYFLIFQGKTENLAQPFANTTISPAPLINAFFAALFSYDGWDILNFGCEEVSNPGRSMAFAIPVGIISVALLYVSVNLAYFIVLPVNQIRDSIAVATTFAQHSLGHFELVVPFLVCVMLVGSINSTLFVASRYMHAAARQGQLPTFLACTNQRHDSPRAALLCHVWLLFSSFSSISFPNFLSTHQLALAIGFSFLGRIGQLISYVSFAMWAQRAFTVCALLKIRLGRAGRLEALPADAIQIPLFFPILFLAISLCLVFVTLAQDFGTSAVGLAMLAASLVAFLLLLWEQAPLPRFRLYRKCATAVNDGLCRFAQLIFDGQIPMDEQEEERKAEIGEEKESICKGNGKK